MNSHFWSCRNFVHSAELYAVNMTWYGELFLQRRTSNYLEKNEIIYVQPPQKHFSIRRILRENLEVLSSIFVLSRSRI